MKRFALALTLLAGFVLVPTGAFAHDKYRDRECYDERVARMEADRIENAYRHGYRYVPSRSYYRSYSDDCRPRYYRSYDCDRRDYRPRSGFTFWFR